MKKPLTISVSYIGLPLVTMPMKRTFSRGSYTNFATTFLAQFIHGNVSFHSALLILDYTA